MNDSGTVIGNSGDESQGGSSPCRSRDGGPVTALQELLPADSGRGRSPDLARPRGPRPGAGAPRADAVPLSPLGQPCWLVDVQLGQEQGLC